MLGEGKDGLKLGKSEYLAMAEIVEIMHMSTMIHDTVLEDGDRLDKGNAAHKMYSSNIAGNKVSILAGDALLSTTRWWSSWPVRSSL
jgi:geranylgeranyl pyrophosphate synthase